MVQRLRAAPDARGLVSALGWYLTKHAVGIYGAAAPERPWSREDVAERQRAIDALPRPSFVDACEGRGVIETYTVLHERDGSMTQALVAVRCEDGRRTLALIEDADVLATLEREEMVGAPGVLRPRADGRNELRVLGA